MKGYFDFKGSRIEYTYERRKRRTVGITISMDKGVFVAVPARMSEEQIRAVIAGKAGWIKEKMAVMEDMRSNIPQRQYLSGETFPYLGNDYILILKKASDKHTAGVIFDGECINVSIPDGISGLERKKYVSDVLVRWYKGQAAEVMKEKTNFYGKRLGIKPSKVVIREQKTRWGSCTRLDTININWKIMLAPQDIADYLVVHELAHLRERNHSKSFWNLVESILPDYKRRREWLKVNGYKLQL